jgi:hypothetical protein
MDPHKRSVTIEVMLADESGVAAAGSTPQPRATKRCWHSLRVAGSGVGDRGL